MSFVDHIGGDFGKGCKRGQDWNLEMLVGDRLTNRLTDLFHRFIPVFIVGDLDPSALSTLVFDFQDGFEGCCNGFRMLFNLRFSGE